MSRIESSFHLGKAPARQRCHPISIRSIAAATSATLNLCLAQLEIRDQAGHAPAVEVACADVRAGHSCDPHPLQRRRHIRHPEAHRLDEFGIWVFITSRVGLFV